jgi:hypothetical protein
MDDQMIRQLLDRYFEGETSLQEEQQLRRAFQKENLPVDLQPFRPLFQYFEHERESRLDQSFEDRLLEQIEEAPSAKIRRLPMRIWAVRIAAAVALALGVFWLYQPNAYKEQQEVASIDWSKYEVDNPEQAFKITQSALLQASQELNQGTKVAAEEFDTKFRKVGQYFN